jgi:hypothetical protein
VLDVTMIWMLCGQQPPANPSLLLASLPASLPFPAGAENQAGTLKEQVPKGCLGSKKVKDALMDLIPSTCFNSVKMNVTNSTGAGCETPGTLFGVAFADAATCLDGIEVGNGTMTPTPGETYAVKHRLFGKALQP